MKSVVSLSILGGVAYLFLSGAAVFFEESFIFYPTRYPQGSWDAQQRGPCRPVDVYMTTTDGVRIHGWYFEHTDADFTLLFFHGNAGNLSDRYDWSCSLTRVPANVFIVDYRGYGRSEGKPDEPGIYRDAEAAYEYLIKERSVPPEKLILYGKSLGGATACELAHRLPVGGLILQSSFTNAADMSSIVMPILPTKLLVRSKLDNLAKISKVDVPKLIIHSRNDEMIPFEMAERLFEAASEPRNLVAFDRAGHNDLIWMHGDAVVLEIRKFVAGLETKPAAPSAE